MKKNRVLVGLSGGVDSAVSAYLLKEQGYEVVAGFMKNYTEESNPNCHTREDRDMAIKVANFLGIQDFMIFDFRKEYEERILNYIYEGYRQGITPNPDILCNNLVKFDLFLQKAMDYGFDFIATGHYARNVEAIKGGNAKTIKGLNDQKTKGENEQMANSEGIVIANEVKQSNSANNKNQEITSSSLHSYSPNNRGQVQGQNKTNLLLRGVDKTKDQSYFLSRLNQYQLSKSLFPLGGMSKSQVRELAQKIGLPNADRPDSQGLCFVGNVPIREFLEKKLPIKKGDVVDVQGNKVGEHDGAWFWTIGQSRGLDLNKKAYVVGIDVVANVVKVSFDRDDAELMSNEVRLVDWQWVINDEMTKGGSNKMTKGLNDKDKNGNIVIARSETTKQSITTNKNKQKIASSFPNNRGKSQGQGKQMIALLKEQISKFTEKGEMDVQVKIRYRQEPLADAKIIANPNDSKSMTIKFSTPQRGIAPGQSIVAYVGEICVGGGVIV